MLETNMQSRHRKFERFISAPPRRPERRERAIESVADSDFAWFRLRELTDFPESALERFSGSRRHREALFQDFCAYLRQARTYWDAARLVRGSAAALPYYYAALQLAKAELLLTAPESVFGLPVHHGLTKVQSKSQSIRGDLLGITKGVFQHLSKSRTGEPLELRSRLRVFNLLSLIPEVGLEMERMSPVRPVTFFGNHAVVSSREESWPLLLFTKDLTADRREPINREILRHFKPIDKTGFDWRDVFSLSSRAWGGSVFVYESRHTFRRQNELGDWIPDMQGALAALTRLVGPAIAGRGEGGFDFHVTPTVTKSSTRVLPIDLVRYAVLFYASSLVRYAPSKIDPIINPGQAFLMDSVIHEVPPRLLLDALDNLTGTRSWIDPNGKRV